MQLPRLLLIFFFFFFFFFFQTINSSPFSDCAPLSYTCGSRPFNISYPFRLTGRADNCGYPGYFVNCTGDNSTLTILNNNKNFQVTSIDYLNSLLNIVDADLLQQSCPDQSYANTSINTSLFQYSDRNRNVTLYFDCSTSHTYPGLFDNGCLTGQHAYYRLDNATMDDLLGRCSSTVVVPLGEEAAEDLLNGKLGFSQALQRGFSVRWVAGGDWCGGCVASGGYCGFNVSDAEQHTCFCPNGTFVGSCDVRDGGNGATNKKKIIEGSAAGAGLLVVCVSLVLYFYKHRKVSYLVILGKKDLNNNKKIEALLEEYGSVAPKRYSYSNVKEITKAFHEKLGQGGYGTVYKGTLRNGHAVAVKILNDSKGDGEEFINEVASICRTSHVNVVSLLGFCHEGSKKALIYDFMCNGSLEKLIYREKLKTTDDWQKLYEIAIGIARGLEYLHRGCNTRIVHFDIKPHNILLDQNFCPKISDFGLAKLCLESIISIAGARGTIGYIAPEVFSRNFGVVSSKSDVYSYGMLMLDIVGGRKNPNEGVENSSETYFPHWIYAQLNQNGHLSTYGITAESEEIVRKMVLVGLWCIQTLPENRPSMSRVVEMMEGSVDDLQVPPKPYLSSSPFGSIIGTSAVQDVEFSSSVNS